MTFKNKNGGNRRIKKLIHGHYDTLGEGKISVRPPAGRKNESEQAI